MIPFHDQERSAGALQRVAVVIPAHNQARLVAATVRAARAIPMVDLVLVVDDGSDDNTQGIARSAGAVVVRHPHNRGRAAALETGAAVVAMRDAPGTARRLLLFLDANLAEAAVNSAPLIEPVAAGKADMSVALVDQADAGRGPDSSLARSAITQISGWVPQQPLTRVRCLTQPAFEAGLPLAHGAGIEAGLAVDLLRRGFVIVEVPAALWQRPRGRQVTRQFATIRRTWQVLLALSSRRVRSLFSLRRAAERDPVA